MGIFMLIKSTVMMVLLVLSSQSAFSSANNVNLTPILMYLFDSSAAPEPVVDRSKIQIINLAQVAQSESLSSLAYLKKEFDAKKQETFQESDKVIFQSYSSSSDSVYTPDNWSAKFDFSGVGWDSSVAGTLITDQHIVFANHYRRGVNKPIIFHAKDGTRIERNVIAVKSLGDYQANSSIDSRIFDVAVAKLDRPVPANIKVYSMFDSRDLSNNKADTQLDGAPFVYTDKKRKSYVESIKALYKYVGYGNNIGSFIIEGWSHDDYNLMHHNPTGGDSGHPSFLVIKGELALLSTLTLSSGVSNHYGNLIVGPYYGDYELIEYMQQAIDQMKDL